MTPIPDAKTCPPPADNPDWKCPGGCHGEIEWHLGEKGPWSLEPVCCTCGTIGNDHHFLAQEQRALSQGRSCRECEERRVAQSGRTHYDGCWRVHLECAIDRMEKLERACRECECGEAETGAALEAAEAEIERLRVQARNAEGLRLFSRATEERAKQAEARLAVAVEALRHVSNYRRDAHRYDEDCGGPFREFNGDDVVLIEDIAREALARIEVAK